MPACVRRATTSLTAASVARAFSWPLMKAVKVLSLRGLASFRFRRLSATFWMRSGDEGAGGDASPGMSLSDGNR